MNGLFPPALTVAATGLLMQARAAGMTLAAAESCTGGLLLGCLTEIAGSSDVVLGGFVTYSNAQKRSLGVSPAMLEAEGAVSAAVAAAMAAATRAATGASVAIAITGIAGPGGGSVMKPVGTVWFAVADAAGVRTRHCLFDGDRTAIRLAAVAEGLILLQDAVAGDGIHKGINA